jgi:hypothetical protein
MQTDSGKHLINPGSVGVPSYTDSLPFFHKMESLSPFAKYAIIEVTGGKLLNAQQLCIKYNYEAAATTARRNWRDD